MDFPNDTDLTWCVEHEIAFPKGRDCPMDWIAVSDKLPDIKGYDSLGGGSDNLLVCVKGHGVDIGWYVVGQERQFWHTRDCGVGADVTHWMPLPEPPKDAE